MENNNKDQDLEVQDLKEQDQMEELPNESAEMETESVSPEPEDEQIPPEPEDVSEDGEPSKIRRFFRKLLIWLVVIAVSFAAGFFVDTYLRYQPARTEIQTVTGELAAAEGEITELEEEVEALSVFEERNQALEEEISSLQTHLTVLSTRVAVADGMLALAADNLPEAKLALNKVESNLQILAERVNEDQIEVVENMQQRHELISEELEQDSFSARSDLEVLASKLVTLENTLFASP